MSIRKHPQSGFWWVDITAPGGERVRRTTGTRNRKDAQEYHDKLKAELWRVHQLGETPQRLFEEACIHFLTASEGQKDYGSKVRHVVYWRDIFGGRTIGSLTNEEVLDSLPTHHSVRGEQRKLSPATRNRYLSSIRRILMLAHKLGWTDKRPILPAYKEPAVRVRWMTHAQADRFLRAMTLRWMRDACAFALATGCRATEIWTLTWDKVDLSRSLAWVTADLAKSGRARAVPLNEDAVEIIRSRIGTHDTFVFSRVEGGAQIRQMDKRAFRAALDQVGIQDFTFHDLRHTWASWHAQSGTPLFVLKEMGGWESLEMVRKYAHLDAGHLAEYANRVTFRSQLEPEKKKAAV